MREVTRDDLLRMRAESPARYWWDYMRLHACLYTWLVERKREPRTIALHSDDGLTEAMITLR